MDLEEMKQAWAALGARVDALEAATSRERLARSRGQLRWTSAGDVVQLVGAIALTAWVAGFWIHHRANPHLLVAGLALHIYGIVAACMLTARLVLVARVYYTEPVLVLQQRLAVLRRFRIRASLALGLPWWLLWVPCTMVAASALCGVDLYAASPGWVWGSLAVGLAGLAGCVWLARRLAGRPIAAPWLARMVDDLAGRSVIRARRELDEVVAFSRD